MLLGYETLQAIPRRDKYTIKIDRIAEAILAKAKGYLSSKAHKTKAGKYQPGSLAVPLI
jgi:hypothetical protein